MAKRRHNLFKGVGGKTSLEETLVFAFGLLLAWQLTKNWGNGYGEGSKEERNEIPEHTPSM